MGAAWTGLVLHKPLRCSGCGGLTTEADMAALVDSGGASDSDRAAIVACMQIVRYGWTSYDSINNAVTLKDGKAVGGLLAGLQRAGLIRRVAEKPNSLAAMIVESKPMFERGPTFPRPE